MFGPQNVSFPMSALGGQKWNYDQVGVAHYGMFPDFLNDVATYPGDGTSTGNTAISNLMSGADYF
jgi:hypothetical protein